MRAGFCPQMWHGEEGVSGVDIWIGWKEGKRKWFHGEGQLSGPTTLRL